MLKTVKNGCGIRVDPPPLFFQNSHIFPFFLGGGVPKQLCASHYSGLLKDYFFSKSFAPTRTKFIQKRSSLILLLFL